MDVEKVRKSVHSARNEQYESQFPLMNSVNWIEWPRCWGAILCRDKRYLLSSLRPDTP